MNGSERSSVLVDEHHDSDTNAVPSSFVRDGGRDHALRQRPRGRAAERLQGCRAGARCARADSAGACHFHDGDAGEDT